MLRAIRFTPPGGKPDYFDEQGRSLRRFFLRSPLKFEPRVTSRFSAAPCIPCCTRRARTAASTTARRPARRWSPSPPARVVSATYDNANGRMVRLRHASGYESYYLHLSAFAPGFARARGRSGQTIGRVGATGLATGPHLHYGLRKNGVWVDPLREHREHAARRSGARCRRWRRSSRARSPRSSGSTPRCRASKRPSRSLSHEGHRATIIEILHGRLFPFRALRPAPAAAARVAAVPYDVVNTDEARALAAGNPLSFLHVSRAEIDLPPDTDSVLRRGLRESASTNFAALKSDGAARRRRPPSLYVYRLRMGAHVQTGVAGCFSLDEYDARRHQEARAHAAGQGRRSHAAHARAARADRSGVPDLPRGRRRSIASSQRAATAAAAVRFHRRRRRAAHASGVSDAQARASCSSRVCGDAGAVHRRRPSPRGQRRARAAAAARRRRRSRASGTPFSPWRFRDDRCSPALQPRRQGSRRRARRQSLLASAAAAVHGDTMARRRRRARGEVAMFLGGHWHTLVLGEAARRCSRQPIGSTSAGCRTGPGAAARHRRRATDKRIDFVGGARGTGELESAGAVGPGGRRLLDVSRQRGRPDGDLGRRRHHAAEVHMVRAEAARRIAVACDLMHPTA